MPIKITIPEQELFNEETYDVRRIPETHLTLEHSLVSISKWEAKWHVAYLSDEERTEEQSLDYIRCMTITQNVDPEIYRHIPYSEGLRIKQYIEDPMTATTFNRDDKPKKRRRKMTSEEIYYYMFANNIPIELEKWHLNRLLVLLEVFGEKEAPPKKRGKDETISRYAALNKARRAKHHTRG